MESLKTPTREKPEDGFYIVSLNPWTGVPAPR